MAAKPPSKAIKDMLVERDIALWDAHHFKTAATTTKYATMKDPVSVCLVTPRAIDRMFYGRGATTDEAVLNALAVNTGLNFQADGLTGAMARLENELHALWSLMWQTKDRVRAAELGIRVEDLDDDVPF